MDFVDQLKQFSRRVETMKDTLKTEEATKTAIIMPFFSMLGYDVFNPQEFVPEYTADVGIKKGEKVDYAIVKDGEPVILIECKAINENLEKHDSQLFRYFGTSTAKFAILTNGLIYKFFTDLDNPNKMDDAPFLTINILNVRNNQVAELKKFCKSEFDIDSIFTSASELKYMHEFKAYFSAQLDNPSDDFLRLFLQGCYSGQKNQTVLERFRPILRKALGDYISEIMNEKIKTALSPEGDTEKAAVEAPAPVEVSDSMSDTSERESRIVTTEEELEAYFVIKHLLSDLCPFQDITYRDAESYFNVLYKNNRLKWICRLQLTDNKKVLILPAEDKTKIKYTLESIYDLEQYSEQLHDILKRFL